VAARHRGLEKRRPERQHARAVRGRALGERGDRLAAGEPLLDLAVDPQQVARGASLDEQGVIALEQPPEERPAARLGLGDDGDGQRRMQRDRIQPGHVIGDDEASRLDGRCVRVQASAEDAQQVGGPGAAHGAARLCGQQRVQPLADRATGGDMQCHAREPQRPHQDMRASRSACIK